ncbi:hypothetical protein FQN60_016165 [Etheostoma spectabile]|uniref:Uncharacterized protein n=1 Tax=Etheostoma spectabile TaxID=54343 RepID=A0A5J5D2F0_9PERO|nr:hypothetical protein FQN60_016165 [Etheostoma spectabile]
MGHCPVHLNFLRTSELTLPLNFTETDLLRKEAELLPDRTFDPMPYDPKPLYPPDISSRSWSSPHSETVKIFKPSRLIITTLTKYEGSRPAERYF